MRERSHSVGRDEGLLFEGGEMEDRKEERVDEKKASPRGANFGSGAVVCINPSLISASYHRRLDTVLPSRLH